MKQIRKGIFETNSSSCHSVSISRDEILRELENIAQRQAELYGYLAEMEEAKTDRLDYEGWE